MASYIQESLRQNLFWLRIMAEHALFIRLGLPCEDRSLREEAQRLQNEFERLLAIARHISRAPTRQAVSRLNEEAIELTTQIIDFKSRVLRMIICCDIRTGFNLPLLVDHIRREAIRFRLLLTRLQNNLDVNPTEALIQDEVFWMRIMADHSRFIAHLLDPSERSFTNQARVFGDRFDMLRLQAADFESMLVPQAFENALLDDSSRACPDELGEGLPNPYSIGSLERFVKETLDATGQLRDFKQAALDLIEACRVLSIIPPLLADHVLREAQRAIDDILLARGNLPPTCRPCPC